MMIYLEQIRSLSHPIEMSEQVQDYYNHVASIPYMGSGGKRYNDFDIGHARAIVKMMSIVWQDARIQQYSISLEELLEELP